MELEVDLTRVPASPRLVDPEDFGSFRVVLVGQPGLTDGVLEPAGVARFDEYAWVRIDALKELAGDSVTPEWEQSLRSMLDFARSRGWVDEELDAVRGHVVRRESIDG